MTDTWVGDEPDTEGMSDQEANMALRDYQKKLGQVGGEANRAKALEMEGSGSQGPLEWGRRREELKKKRKKAQVDALTS
jgi:hypothetical protein